ncbi:MAG: DEAD/DEAH box helicase, partial [Chloroflexi bacterium]|nr:DEAD/DEAH box helicase [Chloroflexota bacterium]
MSLDAFHPIVRTWFERRFGAPTDAQALGWPAIASGRHTLIAAPTGSGKTLAAFLTSLDMLVKQALGDDGDEPGLQDETQVVYVSPLKALANDIQRNLLAPLEEIRALAEEMGQPLPEIRVAVRTGDTPQKERTLHARRPPHVFITTPESLFILLTSERGRHALRTTRTLILDELHAVAPSKRGSHLALSVERLCHLAEAPITRIGLSATQKPIEEMARFLTGGQGGEVPASAGMTERAGTTEGAGAAAGCEIVDTGHRRAMDVAIELPRDFELGPIATHEQWAQTLDQVVELSEQHRTTLVFVNTRRLVERVAHLLSDRLGEENVAAHHGSLSRETRYDTEQRLKEGRVRVCVASASLELGIDIGDIDLVCQIGSPRNIGVALQRVGRSGHFLGGTPKGRFFPLTRDELVETVALLRCIRDGALDALRIPPWPLDVLAQQVVASCVMEEWEEDALYSLLTQAYPYRELERERFDDVARMLSEGVAGRWGRTTAYLHRDGVNRKVKARRGARMMAVSNGGAIPDTADYRVIAEPDGTMVGTVNEDFAIESMAGDIFLLGNTPWKIRRIEQGTVRVEEAQGQPPTIPFWLGEAPGRTVELSHEVSALRRDVDERLHVRETALALVMESGASSEVAEQVVAYVEEGKRVLGIVPTAEKIVAERFFDEAGGMQLVVHSPLGSRINRAWGLALRKRFCAGFNFELQAAATDEGINISLGPQHSFPVEEVFSYLKPATAEDVLTQAVLQSPIFPLRWRWTASRSLALLRQVGGKRVPTPIQRMRSDDLLAAVFPAAAACQDNMPVDGRVEPPDHPLVFETLRDCLTEALDAEGMVGVLEAIESGEIEVFGKDTLQPSAFSHQLLNAMPYAFLDDAPLEERRARAVTLRRALPEDSRDLGALSPDAIAEEEAYAWPAIRDSDELHDALLSLMVLAEDDVAEHPDDAESWREWYASLAEAGRVRTLDVEGRLLWYAVERAEVVSAAYQDGDVEAVGEVVRGRAESSGPFTVSGLAQRLALNESAVSQAAVRLEAEGVLLRGRFRPGAAEEEFCDRRILARIHRSTIGRLRREIEPVPVASFIRFLLEWQHATPGTRLAGDAGLIEVVEQLQGFEAAAAAWESGLLMNRLTDFHASTLDALTLGGELAWGRFARRTGPPPSAALSRNGPVTLAVREDVPWLLDPPDPDTVFIGAAADVLAYLESSGASFMPDIVRGSRRLPSEVEEALWLLVAAGRVTADGFAALRGLVSGAAKRVQRRSRWSGTSRVRAQAALGRAGSRWSLLQSSVAEPEEDVVEARAAQLLRRYGVMLRELLAREPMAPPWGALVRVYRRAEARGEVRGGRFVAGLVGEQFALPEAVDALRAVHRRAPSGEVVRVSGSDPLNLVG